MDSKLDYPACPINHKPQYFCCQIGKDKVLYTKFNRPKGGEYEKFYEEGWKQPRQINFPDAFFTPDSPEIQYDDPKRMCRIRAVYDKSSKRLKETLQCAFEPRSDPDVFVQNKSMPLFTQNFDIFWASYMNPRNNNASFPIGVTCKSIMKKNGRGVDQVAKKQCVAAPETRVFQFTTFNEPPLIVLYSIYSLWIVLLSTWTVLRRSWARKETLTPMIGLSSGPPAGGRLSSDPQLPINDPTRKSVSSDGVFFPRTTPLLIGTADERAKSHFTKHVPVQKGYCNSLIGSLVFWYGVLCTSLLFPLLVIVILDHNQKIHPSLFDINNDLIVVFIIVWTLTLLWLMLIVFFQHQLLNFFRIRQSLDHCQFVHMLKQDEKRVLLTDRSGVSALVAKVEQFFFPNAVLGYEETCRVQKTCDGQRYIEFQHVRYNFDELEGRFVVGRMELSSLKISLKGGLHVDEYRFRLDRVGPNSMEVKLPSILKGVLQELLSFFYVYQLMCYFVWYFTGFWLVTLFHSLLISCIAMVSIYLKRQVLAGVIQLTKQQGSVLVHRDNEWQTVLSSQLVPGDVVQVAENWQVPCDMVLLEGSAVCDESMLTGESMPVQKFCLPPETTGQVTSSSSIICQYQTDRGKKFTLFSGTKTLASGKKELVLGFVVATGAHTTRGQLLQSILYPSKLRFKYDEHLKAVLCFLFLWGIIAAYIAMHFLIHNAGLSNTLFAFVYGMFMLAGVLSPLIPAVITIGQVNAAKRLQRKGLCSLNPQAITLCGKIRIFCFDKTGTITKEGLDLQGFLEVDDSIGVFNPHQLAVFTTNELISTNDLMQSPSVSPHLKFAMASCHSISQLEGDTLVGNQVEMKMFEATKWTLIEEQGQFPRLCGPSSNDELEVIKRFEFDHRRMSMSVVVRHTLSGNLYVFSKGSYEKMEKVCIPASVPVDYTKRAEELSKEGCYLLAIAYKQVPGLTNQDLLEFLSDRDQVESKLSLLGLLAFRNELREDSQEAISQLKNGNVRPVMVTGDNAMTAVYIARKCQMVSPNARVVLGDYVPTMNPFNPVMARNYELVWKDVDTKETFSYDDLVERLEKADTNTSTQEPPLELAVTGKAFEILMSRGQLPPPLLLNIRVFSRMTPQAKVECVQLHMATGAITGMCGDGGNDCGALRAAHVGVALSDSDASVVSPFTSKTKSIASVVDLCREGRCSLATTFGCLKFLILYGFIGCGLRFVMYSNGVFLPEWGFIFLDGFVLMGLSSCVALSNPLDRLDTERPTSSLVGPSFLCSLLGQTLLHVVFLYFGIRHLMLQSWYCPFNPEDVNLEKWWLLQDSNLGTTLFFLIVPQSIVSALACSLGTRFRKPVWRNYLLVAYALGLCLFDGYLLLSPPNRVTDLFRIASSPNVIGLPDIPLPLGFRYQILFFNLANMLSVVCLEYFLVMGPLRVYLKRRFHKDLLQLRV